MIPHLVPEIEGGYPERDGGVEEEEEGQGWGDSRRLIAKPNARHVDIVTKYFNIWVKSTAQICTIYTVYSKLIQPSSNKISKLV